MERMKNLKLLAKGIQINGKEKLFKMKSKEIEFI